MLRLIQSDSDRREVFLDLIQSRDLKNPNLIH